MLRKLCFLRNLWHLIVYSFKSIHMSYIYEVFGNPVSNPVLEQNTGY